MARCHALDGVWFVKSDLAKTQIANLFRGTMKVCLGICWGWMELLVIIFATFLQDSSAEDIRVFLFFSYMVFMKYIKVLTDGTDRTDILT